MNQVTVSPKYQVVIPKAVRRQVAIRSGQKLSVIVREGIISLLPDKPLSAARGFLKGMPVGTIRQKKDRA